MSVWMWKELKNGETEVGDQEQAEGEQEKREQDLD